MRFIFFSLSALLNILISTCNLFENKKAEINSAEYNCNTDSSNTAFLVYDSVAGYLPKSCRKATYKMGEIKIIDSLMEYVVYSRWIGSTSVFGSDTLSQDLKPITEILKFYKRQLLFYTDEKGDKIVWVNCFCNCFDESWKKDILLVKDGGDCYFNFKINLTKRKVFDIGINGEA